MSYKLRIEYITARLALVLTVEIPVEYHQVDNDGRPYGLNFTIPRTHVTTLLCWPEYFENWEYAPVGSFR